MKLYQMRALASLALKEDLLSITAFAERVGYTRSYLQELKNKELSLDFIESVEKRLNVVLFTKSPSSELHSLCDGTESIYWEKCDEFGQFTKTPRARSLWGDKEIIKGYWYTLSKNIRCIKVFDDRMVTSDGLLKEDAIVAIDISQTDYSNGGIFLYSANINNFKILRMARITVKPFDGVIEFSWNNKANYPNVSYTQKELQSANFKIHARVLHDATHLLK